MEWEIAHMYCFTDIVFSEEERELSHRILVVTLQVVIVVPAAGKIAEERGSTGIFPIKQSVNHMICLQQKIS